MAERSAKQLGLSKADLPNSIIEVIATLTKSGFEAYIVGGGVRDTLLGLSPKDFDAVTDAKPHEIKDLFGKRCRIIGRRFQLAHVYSGRDMIEVATFRAPPNGAEHTTSDGMIVRDNVWGDIKQDFARRDFSINAMYYEPIKGVVHDFCDALDDIDNQVIRLLGRAPLRIEEDPVRLLRALRFKAKLGFDFDDALEAQFHDDNWGLLEQVSPHRLYDESQKMFTGGYLVPLLPLLFDYGAIKHLVVYPPKAPTRLVTQVAINTDKRIALGKSINPAFFYAALLWENYLHQLAKFRKKNLPFHDAQMQAAIKVIERQRLKTAIPRFAEQFIRDIWMLQPKLANPRVKQIAQLAEHARFRAGFDFLLLREQCDDAANPLSESTNGMGQWWQDFQLLTEREKLRAIDAFTEDNRRTPNKSSRNRRVRQGQDSLSSERQEYRDFGQDQSEASDLEEDNLNSQAHALQDTANNKDSMGNDSTAKNDYAKGRRDKGDNDSRSHVIDNTNQPAATNTEMVSGRSAKPNTTVVEKAVKKAAKPRPRSPGQKRHDAQERSQLKKLSLEPLLEDTDTIGSTPSPKPLFSISADKLAKQVPYQLEMAAFDVETDADDDALFVQTIQTNSAADGDSQAESRDNRHGHSSSAVDSHVKADLEAVLLPKAETVPTKRRRRQPSQQLTQKEQAAAISQMQATTVDAIADTVVQPTHQTETADGSAATGDAMHSTPQAIAPVDNSVPKTRRRKQPSGQVASTASNANEGADKKSDNRSVHTKNADKPAKLESSNLSHSGSSESESNSDAIGKVVSKSKTATKKAAPNQPAPAAQGQSQQGPAKNERVPTTRRRRLPSSTQSVREREPSV